MIVYFQSTMKASLHPSILSILLVSCCTRVALVLHSKTILSCQTGASKLFCIGLSLFWGRCRTWCSTIWHNMAMWALVEEKRLKHFTPHYWVGDTPWDIRWADRRIFIIISTTAYMPPVVIYVVICGDICATCGDGGGGTPTLVGRETCAKEIFLPSDGSHVWSCDC